MVFSQADIRQFLINIPKHPKRAIVMIVDFFILFFSVWFSLSLRYNTFYLPPNTGFLSILVVAPVIGVITFFIMGIYKTVTRFLVFSDIIRLYLAIIITAVIWAIYIYIFNSYAVMPRSIPLSFMFFSLFLIGISRWFAASLLNGREQVILTENTNPKEIIIYGAGVTGLQLAEKLSKQNSFEVKGFIDDNPALWKRRILRHKVHSRDFIAKLIQTDNVKEVILAMPSASLAERKKILSFLEPYSVAVRTLPAIEDIASGKISVAELKMVGVEDLLGRDPVPANRSLFDKVILDKSVLITGAGGSIGSELCRQIFKTRPKNIILFDVSEAALYLIEQKIFEYQTLLSQTEKSYQDINIISIIGSVLDKPRVLRVLQQYQVHSIFHAAAYKHVPLVESNPIIGIYNNVWGTKIVADAALETGVKRFVLISTDKAVRPTNIMGATKRLAEMYLQALSDENNKNDDTIFTMVRFGNVLDSSGSVVQKFRQQITKGGPVTITHPDITRFFMSIPEAAELVIQAGAMAKGGEVYILDMGESVKILDLASSMIRLMGLEIHNKGNPNGDIKITFIGLRPGEKLSEELLIEETSTGTDHSRIQKNKEPFLDYDTFKCHLDTLHKALTKNDINMIYHQLEEIVSGYKPSKEIKALSDSNTQADKP